MTLDQALRERDEAREANAALREGYVGVTRDWQEAKRERDQARDQLAEKTRECDRASGVALQETNRVLVLQAQLSRAVELLRRARYTLQNAADLAAALSILKENANTVMSSRIVIADTDAFLRTLDGGTEGGR